MKVRLLILRLTEMVSIIGFERKIQSEYSSGILFYNYLLIMNEPPKSHISM